MLLFALLICGATFVTGQLNPELNVTGIRLVNGSGPYEGRVEIQMNGGIWVTICDDGFDRYDAQVLCRMMNLSYTAYLKGARHGKGYDPVFNPRLSCKGYEADLNECDVSFLGYKCWRPGVSLICSECGSIQYSNDQYPSISSDGRTLTAACTLGAVDDQLTSYCNSSGVWSRPSILCQTPITDIRLVNGSGLYDGRVEVKMNGTWGDVCANSVIRTTPGTICKLLFDLPVYDDYDYYYYYYYYASRYYYYGYNPNVNIDRLDCNGDETNISECYYQEASSCSLYYRLAVMCDVYPLSITDIRLVNGTGPYEGRVELRHGDTWGTVCGYGVDALDAVVLCRMLNMSLKAYYTNATFGQGTGPILLSNMQCDTAAYHINDCSRYYPPMKSQCSHANDVSVICTDHQLVNDIRLADGKGLYDGQVEVDVNGTVGYLCYSSFSYEEASAICKTLFGSPRYASFLLKYFYSTGPGTAFVDELDCRGDETDINQCNYYISNTCRSNRIINIDCNADNLNITDIRLVPGPYHGVVEIKVNDTWGTICRGYFNSRDGEVICRMFGLTVRRTYAQYGQVHYTSSGPTYIERLNCVGFEESISSCSYVSGDTCRHRNSYVECNGPELNFTDVRLVDGTGPYDGRAEIFVNNTWGTICARYPRIYDADAFCYELGLRGTQYSTSENHDEGTGPVHIEELSCFPPYSGLRDCNYTLTNWCDHQWDVSFVCSECGAVNASYWNDTFFTYNGTSFHADCEYYGSYIGRLEMKCDNVTQQWIIEGECREYRFPLDITDIRLYGGNASSNGRVEIKSMETWGTVCQDGFGMTEANTVCRMLGFWPAISYDINTVDVAENSPIFVDELTCSEEASHINNCTYETRDDCTHGNDVWVVCLDCGDPTPLHGMVNSSRTNYGTTIEVSCKPGYRLIGDRTISCDRSGTWTDRPFCELLVIDCGNPGDIPNGTMTSTNGTYFPSVITYSCDKGFSLLGHKTRTCQANGEWSGCNPRCQSNKAVLDLISSSFKIAFPGSNG